MIPDLIASAISHPLLVGLAIGGMGFGGPLGIIGWSLGYEAAMRKATSWMRERTEVDGDMPTLPHAIAPNNIDQTWGR